MQTVRHGSPDILHCPASCSSAPLCPSMPWPISALPCPDVRSDFFFLPAGCHGCGPQCGAGPAPCAWWRSHRDEHCVRSQGEGRQHQWDRAGEGQGPWGIPTPLHCTGLQIKQRNACANNAVECAIYRMIRDVVGCQRWLISLGLIPNELSALAPSPALQWPYRAVAGAFEVIPRTLAQNCGVSVIRTLTALQAKVGTGRPRSLSGGGLRLFCTEGRALPYSLFSCFFRGFWTLFSLLHK